MLVALRDVRFRGWSGCDAMSAFGGGADVMRCPLLTQSGHLRFLNEPSLNGYDAVSLRLGGKQ